METLASAFDGRATAPMLTVKKRFKTAIRIMRKFHFTSIEWDRWGAKKSNVIRYRIIIVISMLNDIISFNTSRPRCTCRTINAPDEHVNE